MRYYIWKNGEEILAWTATPKVLPPPAIEVDAAYYKSLKLPTPISSESVQPNTENQEDTEIAALRAAKLHEAGQSCSAAIYAGIDVGGSHYSLTEHDQTEIMAQYTTVKEGVAAVPYHADGELCRMYTAEEFTALAKAATAHIFYHRTYCNHVNAWIRRADLEELWCITYGAALPEDLAEHMAAVLATAGGGADDA